ncbi:MAG: DNRLRE domain-containing protein, partial [Caldithrix sp.]|nr:DNRLRE domain-containing protein [Caldithrix sp.]
TVQVRLPDDQQTHQINVFVDVDQIPPAVDTVAVLSDSTLRVRFSEPVLMDRSPNGALNKDNYRISGNIRIDSIAAHTPQNEVTLHTSHHQHDVNYVIQISNIADGSSQQNIMASTEFTYSILTRIQVVLQDGLNGYNGTRDSHIAEYFPQNNMGGNDQFEACRFGGDLEDDDKSSLIRFDLSQTQIIDSSLVKAAVVLTLAETRNGAAPKELGAYRLLSSWKEGLGSHIDGNAAAQGEVTWLSALHNIRQWQAPGGDFHNLPADVVTVYSTPGQTYAWDVTPLVRFWKARADSNFGIILREPQPSSANGTKTFYAREHTQTDWRPKLVFTYKDSITSVPSLAGDGAKVPQSMRLKQNYPNPFNATTTIRFSIPRQMSVTLTIYNVRGQMVDVPLHSTLNAGAHQVHWQADHLSSGLYFYRLKTPDGELTRRCLFIK